MCILYFVQGMLYLHKSTFQSHGNLTSAVCHVDNRWVLKIGGFRLHVFRDDADTKQVTLHNCSFYAHKSLYASVRKETKNKHHNNVVLCAGKNYSKTYHASNQLII